jgi:hypothetical protein
VNEQAEMNKLLELLCYLPLAIVQAAAYISSRSGTLSSYLELYYETPLAPVDLLGEDFEDLERDEEGTNAVFQTWAISFHQIRRENEQVAAMLSLMSFFDPQGIPESLLSKQVVGLRDFGDVLGNLKGFSLITDSHTTKAIDLHRLVRVCIQE